MDERGLPQRAGLPAGVGVVADRNYDGKAAPRPDRSGRRGRPKVVSRGNTRAGKWRHLWRIAGAYANVSVFDVADQDELHAILSTLPLFPFMDIAVTPLARHPSAID